MAKRTVYISDLSGKELDTDAVKITLSFTDARRGTVVVDASPEDETVRELIRVGMKQARRGRKPKGEVAL